MEFKRVDFIQAKKVALNIPPGGRRTYYNDALSTLTKAATALWSDIDFIIQNPQLTAKTSMQLKLFVDSGKGLT